MSKKWQKVRLGDVITYRKGFAFDSNNFLSTGKRVIRISDTTRTSIKDDSPVYVSHKIAANLRDYELRDNDIILTTVGSRPPLYDSMVGKVITVPVHAAGSLLNQNMVLLRVNQNQLAQDFLGITLRTREFVNFIETLIRGNANQVSIALNELFKFSFLLPPLSEQTAIASLLTTWDLAIEKTERLLEAKEKRFKWLLKRLISRDKHTRGHIRDFTNEVSKRNSDRAINRVLSVTNNRGFVLPEDQFERRVASSDMSNYKIVTKGQYAYNPSRINVGSIARLGDWDKGVLSPMYVVFKVNEKKVSSDFFLHWLSSHEARERIRRSAQGSVRETVSFTDFGAIPFPLPLIEQQKVIAETLNTARYEIDLLKKQADAYRKQKRGLMQKLLTGEWRVKGE